MAPASFEEVEGGLIRMTFGRFRRLIEEQQFRIRELQLIPIKGRSDLTKSKRQRAYFTIMPGCTLIK
jgi:hypothetical protein